MGWLGKLAEALGVRLDLDDVPDDRLPQVVQAAERFAIEMEERWDALPPEFKKWDEQVEGRVRGRRRG